MGSGEPRWVDLSAANLDGEHVCCAIAGKEHQEGVDRELEAGR